jgi:hypothetical protein
MARVKQRASLSVVAFSYRLLSPALCYAFAFSYCWPPTGVFAVAVQ